MSKKKLKKRLKALEKIVSKDAITLTNPDNPNEKVVLFIADSLFQTKKVKYTLNTEETIFETTTLEL